MAIGKITKRTVEAVERPSEGKRAYLWDEVVKGFGVMVTDKGKRSYIVQYRIGGRGSPTRRVTIGTHGSPYTAEKATARAKELLDQVRRKVDPFDAARAVMEVAKAEKAQEKVSAVIAERLGFSTFADRWVEHYAKANQLKTWRDQRNVINRDLKPRLHNRSLTEITDADLIELIDAIKERSGSGALRAYSILNLIFGYACDKERRYLPPAKNPMFGIKPPYRVGIRDRTLTDDELRLVWLAAGDLGGLFGPITQLLILTGQRRGEVGGLSWSEIDKDANVWLLPGARSKNKLPNLIPLTDAARAIIDVVPVVEGKAQFLFTRSGACPATNFAQAKAKLDALMLVRMRSEAAAAGASEKEVAALTVSPWTFHDLRRTFATGCQRLGFPTEVTEAVINHVGGSRAGIVGVYQTYRYQAEKRAALEAWSRHVALVIEGRGTVSNVIPLARSA